MDPILIAVLIKNIAIPEILRFLATRRANNQPDPTAEEVYAHLATHIQQIQSAGQVFLDATRPPS